MMSKSSGPASGMVRGKLQIGPFVVGSSVSLIVTLAGVWLTWTTRQITPWIAWPVSVLSTLVIVTLWISAFRALRRPAAPALRDTGMTPAEWASGKTLNEWRAERGLPRLEGYGADDPERFTVPRAPSAYTEEWEAQRRAQRVDGDE